jgi:hypothetical protein
MRVPQLSRHPAPRQFAVRSALFEEGFPVNFGPSPNSKEVGHACPRKRNRSPVAPRPSRQVSRGLAIVVGQVSPQRHWAPAGRVKLRLRSDRLPGPEESTRHVVKRLEARTCDPHHFACLHASSLVTGDDVRLNHHAHVLTQRDFRLVSRGAALGADNRLEVASAITMHNVIAGCKAVCLDD